MQENLLSIALAIVRGENPQTFKMILKLALDEFRFDLI